MILHLILLMGLPALYNAQFDCTVDNGGCAHYCIDRGDGNLGSCACQCYYQVGSDKKSCVPADPCDVDILWMTDFSTGLLKTCELVAVVANFPANFTPFEIWRDTVAEYFNVFSTQLPTSQYSIGTMVSTKAGLIVTHNYSAETSTSNLEAGLKLYDKTQICGKLNVFEGLFRSFEHDAQPIDVLGPENARDGVNTTRIAVVAMLTPLGGSYDSVIDNYLSTIYGHYDQVFVIGKKDTSQLSGESITRIDPQLRQLACNDSTSTSCLYLFYTDSTNDGGAMFDSSGTVVSMIDTSACIKRKPANVHSIMCGSSSATITIPSCRLGGLNKDDMTLNDVTCTGATNAVLSGDNVIFTVPYDTCSWASSSATVNGITYLTLSQNVVPKTYANSGDSITGLDFGGSCSFPRYTDEQLGILNPIVAEASGSAEENGTIPYRLLLYTDDTYGTAYDDAVFPLSRTVLDTLFFAADATLPSNLKIVLKDFVATSTSDRETAPESYTIVENQCIRDNTFTIGDTTNDEIEFSMVMFEFTSTATETDANKLPIFFHATLYLCETSDSSNACKQTCAKKKRDVSDEEPPTQMQTIGPFFPGSRQESNKKKKNDKEIEGAKQLDETISESESEKSDDAHAITYQIYLPAPSVGIMCYWFLFVLATAALLHSLLKCFSFLTKSKKAEPWIENAFPNVTKG